MPVWARALAALATLRVAAALVLYLSGLTTVASQTAIHPAVYAWLALTFGALGLALLTANRNDIRAAWLGGVLLLIAVPLTSAVMPTQANPALAWMGRLRPDAFLGAFLWRLAVEFPAPPSASLRRAGAWVAAGSALLGAVAFATNLSLIWSPLAADTDWRARLATGVTTGGWYWPIVLLPSAGAFVSMLVRMLRSQGDDRARSTVFICGLVAGILPFFLEVLAEETWAPYKSWAHSPAVEPVMGAALFGALGIVPFVTAYAVVYDRVVDVRLVLRTAIQHALARYTIAATTLLPVAALGLYLFNHRTEPLGALMSGRRPVLLLAAVVGGGLAWRWQRRLLKSIDRRYFREEYNAQELVASLLSPRLVGQALAVTADHVSTEIERALHARADLYVADAEGLELRDPRGQRAPLSLRSTLVTLAFADAQPMAVELAPGSVGERLPPAERAWLAHGEYRLVLPLKSRDGDPVGVLALGPKRSELPFSAADRRMIAALATPLMLALENDRLRQRPPTTTEPAARECLACSRMHTPEAARCSCGGELVEGLVPHLLRGVYRFDRRIGAGGMGVVYHATDVALQREVAVKTLPRLSPRESDRLHREARAMATLVHPHLAVIYGIETWRGVPFLIEEYLAAGTLVDRLAAGPLAIREVVDLGLTLCAVLGDLHEAGVVHCDIKPSNIGFAHNGTMKLLDFGLAHLLRSTGAVTTTAINIGTASAPSSVMVSHGGVKGTPPYMSPEAMQAGPPSPAFDLWATAVVLYEAIAGRRPFQGRDAFEIFESIARGAVPSLTALRADCPMPVEDFLTRALAPGLADRPADSKAFAAGLLALRPHIA